MYTSWRGAAWRGFGQGVHSIVAHYVLNHGTEEQKQRWLPRLAARRADRRDRHDRARRRLGSARASARAPCSRATTT